MIKNKPINLRAILMTYKEKGLDLTTQVNQWYTIYTSRCKSKGKDDAIRHLKSLYDLSKRYALERPLIPVPWCKTNHKGFPRSLSTFEPRLKGTPEQRQAALTILRQYADFTCSPVISTETITSPSNAEENWKHLSKPWSNFLKNFIKSFKSLPILKEMRPHISSKRGPNGPCLASSHVDALAVTQDDNLFQSICNLAQLLGEDDIKERIQRLSVLCSDCNPKSSHTGRLHFISEGGGKTRVIAICDYWSQSVCKPIHQYLMEWLKLLKTDGTYSHNRVASLMKAYTLEGKHPFCFDLSSATDRFPVFLQENVISAVLGQDVAKEWRKVVTDRAFALTGHSATTVRYSVGQPMGILSSWPAFAITHHAIIQFCALLEDYPNFRDYIVIGDDVAIFSEKVAKRYLDVMKVLEVQISSTKSITPSKDSSSAAGEIAKRLFLNGKEISPIPPDILKSAWKDFRLFPLLLQVYRERGVLGEIPEPREDSNFIEYPNWVDALIKCAHRREYYQVLNLLTFPTPGCALIKGVTSEWEKYNQEVILDCYQQLRIKKLERMVLEQESLFGNRIEDNPMGYLFNYRILGEISTPDIGFVFNSESVLASGGISSRIHLDPAVRKLHPLQVACEEISKMAFEASWKFSMFKEQGVSKLMEIEYIPDCGTPVFLRVSHQRMIYQSSLVLKVLKIIKEVEVQDPVNLIA
jgi:hypothetical protein